MNKYISLTPKQEKFVRDFVTEIESGDAAIFAGAGLSASSGFVNWKELLKDLAEEVDLDIDKEYDLVSVAQYHFNKFKRAKINDKIINEFTTLKKGSENHYILARIGIDTFWTTNYDQLIERTLEEEGKKVEIKTRNEDFSRNIKKKNAIVYKMHGDKNAPDEAVLIKDDYETYSTKRQFFTTALRGDLLSKTFLFIGFSFDDPNLEQILSQIKVLLKDNTPTHYCFFKEISEEEFNNPNKSPEENKEEFLYAKIKQNLKIDDLVRYGIRAIMIRQYTDITSILLTIEERLKRRNVFISGAVHNYAPYSENEAVEFIHKLSYKIAENNYKIVSGYGLGIGSIVINGALEYKLNSTYQSLDDLLILRPFPQIQSGKKTIAETWTEYRNEMISKAGIAIFLFGNKLDVNGQIINSNGMLEEFEICLKNNVIPIPIGVTGSVARLLWERIASDFGKYYTNDNFAEDFMALGDSTKSLEEIVDYILKSLYKLQIN